MGTDWLPVVIKNDSPLSCFLSGIPTVQLIAGPASPLPTKQQDGPPSNWHRSYNVSRVVLAASQSGSFTVVFQANSVGGEACPQASGLEVTVPGVARSLWATTDFAPCGGLVFVLPIRTGVAPVQEPT
jgi:hypothetical protein